MFICFVLRSHISQSTIFSSTELKAQVLCPSQLLKVRNTGNLHVFWPIKTVNQCHQELKLFRDTAPNILLLLLTSSGKQLETEAYQLETGDQRL